MQKQAPTLGRLLVMVAFALSCFGLLLFLWLAFGGSIPLAPKGYRFYAAFPSATQSTVLGNRLVRRISHPQAQLVDWSQPPPPGRRYIYGYRVEASVCTRTGLPAGSRRIPVDASTVRCGSAEPAISASAPRSYACLTLRFQNSFSQPRYGLSPL